MTFLTTFLTTFLAAAEASGATGWGSSSSLRFGGAPLPLEEITRLGLGDAFLAVMG